MSSPVSHPRPPELQSLEWARLIPGVRPPLRDGRKKPPQSIRPAPGTLPSLPVAVPAGVPESVLALLLPAPLRGRMAWSWLRTTTLDSALVGLNWLLIGAFLVPLRKLFPHVPVFRYASGAPLSLLGLALLHAVLIVLFATLDGQYRGGKNTERQAWILGRSVLWATAILGIAYGAQFPVALSALIAAAGFLHFASLLLWRLLNCQAHAVGPRDHPSNVLIIGAGGVGRQVAAQMLEYPEDGRALCGFLDDERPLGDGIIGRVRDLARLARAGFVDGVILAAPRDRALTSQVIHEARRLRLDVEMVPELFGCKPAGNEFTRVGELPVICLHAERQPSAGLVLKRLVDITGASIALLLFSPLLAAIAGLIKLDSRGPVLYAAQRAGRKGKSFRCEKFRTMVQNADELKSALRPDNQRSGPIFKIAKDPRITRLGAFLRRYSLDELPQLWNVLIGDMSLVGPRPHPVDEYAAYEIRHRARLDVTPGITGLWQVTARRDPSFERAMELDREYIRTWSLGGDLQILLKTFQAVARGSGD
jgi:exopolysaccharide biosynthesis polyprenyl glycosylphosphotransferase